MCAANGSNCSNAAVTFGTALNAAPLETGNGSNAIAQGDYNLVLAAAPAGADTTLYAGTTDLYRCSLEAGCTLRNTTDAENGCLNPAGVAGAQHAIALGNASLLFLGNDGGLWRSTDGANETSPPCSLDDKAHFSNLNGGLGSLAEAVSFAQAPADPGMLLAGLGALGTAGTGAVTNSWAQLSAGEGGTVAIDAANPLNWYVSTGPGVSIGRCTRGAACTAADFAMTSIGAAQVGGDDAALHAPWLLDPGASDELIVGTCRAWRGPAAGRAYWSSADIVSSPFGSPAASGCAASQPVVRSLGAGGAIRAGNNMQNAGSEVLYAGLAGALDGGAGFGGHLFVTSTANTASASTPWSDAALSPVTNDSLNGGLFNPGRFDISSVAADPHDATGATAYATIMGFTGNGVSAPHLYRTADAGAHWLNISSNLPNAPANSAVVDPNDANTLYVALDTGVYVTTDVRSCAATNCWSIYGTSLPNAPVMQLEAAAAMPTGDGRTGELRAATYGRGIWQIPLLTALSPAAPMMAISPASVTYSAGQVGAASPYVSLTVTNTGNAPLAIGAVIVSGDFNEMDTCAGAAIQLGGSCVVEVRFAPAAVGTRTGVLTVYGNVAGGQISAQLSGVGVPPATIVLTPLSLNFGAVSVGATSTAQSVTISNTGGTTSRLAAPVMTGDFAVVGNTCGTSLAPQTGCTLSIAFAPTAAGARSGTLTEVDDAGTQVVSLLGSGINPATDAISPTSLNFAPQQLNTSSAAQVVTITNAGDVALTLIAAQIASGDFSVVNGCGASLNAHASCAISVSDVPKSVGPGTGTLTIADQYRTQQVALSGVGLAPPGVSLSPIGGLDFGAIGVSLSAAAQTLTLTNNGGVPLALTGVSVSGDYALAPGSNTCGASVAPAAVCTVAVTFSPGAPGIRTGTVTFSDNATNSPQSVPLTGVGVDFSLGSNGPGSISIANGSNATYALLLSSVAGLPGSTAFTCAGVPAHATCTVNPAAAALGGTTNVTVTVATGLLNAEVAAPPMPWARTTGWLALLLPLGFAWRRRRLRPAALAALLLLAGCSARRTVPATVTGSGGGAIAVTPSGTYTLVVAGSSAGLVRSVNLTLVVQ